MNTFNPGSFQTAENINPQIGDFERHVVEGRVGTVVNALSNAAFLANRLGESPANSSFAPEDQEAPKVEDTGSSKSSTNSLSVSPLTVKNRAEVEELARQRGVLEHGGVVAPQPPNVVEIRHAIDELTQPTGLSQDDYGIAA